jgi:hypothetical protein
MGESGNIRFRFCGEPRANISQSGFLNEVLYQKLSFVFGQLVTQNDLENQAVDWAIRTRGKQRVILKI